MFVNYFQYFMSGLALIVSIITAIYTINRNRDVTHVFFNKPVFITSSKGRESSGPEVHGAASDDETRIKTSIEIINASNHNRGYFDYKLQVHFDSSSINIRNKRDVVSGNLRERSHNTLMFEGITNRYIDSSSDFEVVVSVKIVKRRIFNKSMYIEKRANIKNILWGTGHDHVLEQSSSLDKPNKLRSKSSKKD